MSGATLLAEEEVGEVETGVLPPELEGLAVVGHGGVLGGVECAEPEAAAVAGEANLRHPPPPVPLPDAPVELAGGNGGGREGWPEEGVARRSLPSMTGRLVHRYHMAPGAEVEGLRSGGDGVELVAIGEGYHLLLAVLRMEEGRDGLRRRLAGEGQEEARRGRGTATGRRRRGGAGKRRRTAALWASELLERPGRCLLENGRLKVSLHLRFSQLQDGHALVPAGQPPPVLHPLRRRHTYFRRSPLTAPLHSVLQERGNWTLRPPNPQKKKKKKKPGRMSNPRVQPRQSAMATLKSD